MGLSWHPLLASLFEAELGQGDLDSMKAFVYLAILLASSTLQAGQAAPVPIILDTDISGDVDDVGAVTILHVMANRGEAKILAMGICMKNPWSALCLDALNTYFRRPDIPLGVVKGPAFPCPSNYAEGITKEFPHALKSAEDAPDAALDLSKSARQTAQPKRCHGEYRIANQLSESPEVRPGSAQQPRRHGTRETEGPGVGLHGRNVSPGTGDQSRHRWPSRRLCHRPLADTDHLQRMGDRQRDHDGSRAEEAPAGTPVRRAYELFNGLNNRQSWDQTAVLYAVRGLNGGLADYWDLRSKGYLHVSEDGSNVWRESPDKAHSYLVKKMPPAKIAAVIEELMLSPTEKR